MAKSGKPKSKAKTSDLHFYHLGFSKSKIAKLHITKALLSGDPARAERIAKKYLKKPKRIADHRGLSFWIGQLKDGEWVLSATSGMGAPSASIIFNELVQAGIRTVIRIGTTGAIQEGISVGEVIISQAALCRQGAALDIAPVEFPAAADPEMTMRLVLAAREKAIPAHIGVTASVDTFYEGQERTSSSANSRLIRSMQGVTDEYRDLGILNYEMESGTLFKMGLIYKVSVACICGVIAQRRASERVDQKMIRVAEDRAIQIAVHALGIKT